MKKNFFLVAVLHCQLSVVFAQKEVGPLIIDSSFGTFGRSIVDFNSSNDEVTAYEVLGGKIAADRKIIIAGTIALSNSSLRSFGMLQYSPDGILDQGFGVGGKKVVRWSQADVPKSIHLYPSIANPFTDTMIMACGYAVVEFDTLSTKPTIYRFSVNGNPDPAFGDSGRAIVNYFPKGHTEFNFLARLEVGYAVCCGYGEGIQGNPNGFCASWINQFGEPDTNYGNHGSIFIPAPIKYATGYFTDDLKIIFVGITNDQISPKLILARLTENGIPDSSFGTNGILSTDIVIDPNAKLLTAYLKSVTDNSGNILVCTSLVDTPGIVSISFKVSTGMPDSSYGTNGYTSISTPNIIPTGLVISNDGSALISAIKNQNTKETLFFKIVFSGQIDSSFGVQGIAKFDAETTEGTEIIRAFNSVGGKKFIGIGTMTNSNSDFLLTRYRQSFASMVSVSKSSTMNNVYPNPLHNHCNIILSKNLKNSDIQVINSLGIGFEPMISIVKNLSAETIYDLDFTDIPKGNYLVIVKVSGAKYKTMPVTIY